MQAYAFWLLLSLLVTLMMTLTWVGLRFFCPSEGPTSRPKPRWPRPQLRFPVVRLVPLLALIRSRHALCLAASLLVVGFTVAFTLTLSRFIDPPAMTGKDLGPTTTVGEVLKEEILVPPQPLPPSLFIGTGAFDLEHANRDWSKLDGRFRTCVLQLFARMEARGYPLALLEGYRTPERQEMLAAKGPDITHARAGQSRHQHGLAADLAPVRDNRLHISERDPWAAAAYKALGEEAGRLGLVWGGGWTMRDLGHVETATRTHRLPNPSSSWLRPDPVLSHFRERS